MWKWILETTVIATLAAIVGAAIAAAALSTDPSYWDGLVGSLIGAAVTAGAVLFTARHTLAMFNRETARQKQAADAARRDEIRRALAICHLALEEDIQNLRGVEKLITEAVAKETEDFRFYMYRRALRLWQHPHHERIERIVDALGDVEAQVTRVLMSYSMAGYQIRASFEELQSFAWKDLHEGFTAGLADSDFQLIRLQRHTARTAQFLIDDFLVHTGNGELPRWRNANFTEEQEKIRKAELRPIDLQTMRPVAD